MQEEVRMNRRHPAPFYRNLERNPGAFWGAAKKESGERNFSATT